MLVFNTTVLHHFALADRLDVLANMVAESSCATTSIVLDELRSGAVRHPMLTSALELDWMRVIALDGAAEIRCFAAWVRRAGAGARHMGEASVFAAAQISSCTADRRSRRDQSRPCVRPERARDDLAPGDGVRRGQDDGDRGRCDHRCAATDEPPAPVHRDGLSRVRPPSRSSRGLPRQPATPGAIRTGGVGATDHRQTGHGVL